MTEIIAFLRELIDRFGLVAALLVIVIINYVMQSRSFRHAENKARDAATAQQEAVTKQFTAFAADNRRLQAAVDALEAAQSAADADRVKMALELDAAKKTSAAQETAMKAAQDKAISLEAEVKTLAGKVAVLESEKAAQASELERERTEGQALKRSLTAANTQIAQLRDRVSNLEGQNQAMKEILEKIRIVAVGPPEPEPPSPPPLLHLEPHEHEERKDKTA